MTSWHFDFCDLYRNEHLPTLLQSKYNKNAVNFSKASYTVRHSILKTAWEERSLVNWLCWGIFRFSFHEKVKTLEEQRSAQKVNFGAQSHFRFANGIVILAEALERQGKSN